MLLFLRSRQENAQPPESVKPEVSQDMYWRIFSTEYNLGFQKPKTDTCSKCDALAVAIKMEQDPDDKSKLEGERDNRQNDAKFAYEAKKRDKKVTFDLIHNYLRALLYRIFLFRLSTLSAYYFGT